ncbi:type IV secretion system protein (plasmid) [Burkholderia cenocepacia]|uniref:type IV secretion system protein n=1 Tax=Burkholderia cenocepacia TaxID=95486 RepID=UPI00209D1A05|nr:type IV secretion system protein [Burkholderia cenocepacia]MCO8402813.1 type IV secretion system protein [Burkholderia cenocepacia]MCO8415052.1 type IV secretion system protein [Burkholderia cenocepacia]MCO8423052.1 type IV secretion system protein [Burkholderia cenocepacia]MCO8474799.1 type IV secretion system protein [Burkholderia cenocepacia]MCO8482021.1 type IV secretion system protein [Burkholderia cenocepacia]
MRLRTRPVQADAAPVASSTPTAANTPPTGAATKRRQKYYAVFDRTSVANRWLVGAVIVLLLIDLVQSSAIRYMLPLERIVPYFLRQSPNIPGRVERADVIASEFTPSQLQQRIAIEDWVNEVWGIDPALTQRNLEHAATLTAGAAVNELKQLVRQEDVFGRMASTPTLKRDPTVLSTDFIGSDVAIVRLALVERNNGTPAPPTYKSMTIHFSISPPKTYQEAARSLVGLTISDFSHSDARALDAAAAAP